MSPCRLLDAASALFWRAVLQPWSSAVIEPFNSWESTKLGVRTDVFHVTLSIVKTQSMQITNSWDDERERVSISGGRGTCYGICRYYKN